MGMLLLLFARIKGPVVVKVPFVAIPDVGHRQDDLPVRDGTQSYTEIPEGTLSGNIILSTLTKELDFTVLKGYAGYPLAHRYF